MGFILKVLKFFEFLALSLFYSITPPRLRIGASRRCQYEVKDSFDEICIKISKGKVFVVARISAKAISIFFTKLYIISLHFFEFYSDLIFQFFHRTVYNEAQKMAWRSAYSAIKDGTPLARTSCILLAVLILILLLTRLCCI